MAASCSLTIREAIDVNNRIQLAEVRRHLQDGILTKLMLSGVTIVDPILTTIDAGVSIGQDSVIKPGTVVEGDVTVGANCVIGPNVHVVGPRTIPDGSMVN